MALQANPQDPPRTLTCNGHGPAGSRSEHINWCQGADLLLHECNFRNKDVDWALTTGHSWTDRVAHVARLSTPKKLLLTHLNPLETSSDPVESDLIRQHIKGELLLAEDGLEVHF